MNPEQSQHQIDLNNIPKDTTESVLLSKIEKKISLPAEDKEQINTILHDIEQTTQRPKEDTDKFISNFVDNFQGEKQCAKELAFSLEMIEKAYISSPDEALYFKADPIQYVNEITGTIKSSDRYKGLQKDIIDTKKDNKDKEIDNKTTKEDLEKGMIDFGKVENNLPPEFPQISKEQLTISDKQDKQINMVDFMKERLPSHYTEQQITDFLRYQVYLHNKLDKTIEEQVTANNFSTFLSSSGIDSEKFFSSLSSSTSTRNEAVQESPTSKPTLATIGDPRHVAEMKGLKETTAALPSSFAGPERKIHKLLSSFPLPKGWSKEGFMIKAGTSLDQLQKDYTELTDTNSPIDYPLFDNNPQSHKGSEANRNLRHLAFCYQLVESNPTMDKRQFANVMIQLNIPPTPGMQTPDQIRTLSQSYLAPQFSQRLQTIDTDLRQQAIPRYMSMIQGFLSGTPGLQNFNIKPGEIEIKPDGMTIPYRLPGHEDDTAPDGQITMDSQGNISVTNPLYDQGNPNSVTNIVFGKVNVGKTKTLQEYHTEITSNITPEDFLSALSTESPEKNITDKAKQETQRTNAQIDQEFEFTKTRLSHQLSGTQVAEAGFEMMRSFHLDDTSTLSQSDKKTSPYDAALQQYNFAGDNSKDKIINPDNKDLYTITTILRNSSLGSSSEENKRLKNGLQKLNSITKNEQFITHLKTGLPDAQSLSSSPNKVLLACCHPDNKKNPQVISNLLSLLCHRADDPQNRTIDLNKLDSLVMQLESIQQDPKQIERFNIPVERSHVLETVTDGQQKENADQTLEQELEEL